MRADAASALSHRLGHSWLAAFVEAIDLRLRARHKVFEFSQSPRCIFRIQLGHAGEVLTLDDGTRIGAESRVVNLHIWNAQMPRMPSAGATIAWARLVHRNLEFSLNELAKLLAARADLDDVVALRADMRLGTAEESDQLLRIAGRYGFEPTAQQGRRSVRQFWHDFGENIFMTMMVLASNAPAFRWSVLRRGRKTVYLSRSRLMQRFGFCSRPGAA